MTTAKQTIKAWSVSRLGDYESCPLKAKYKVIDKLPDPGGPAMVRGQEIHKAAEDFVTGAVDEIIPELNKVAPLLHELRIAYARDDGSVFVEQELAFDAAWKPVDWFAPNAWLRVKTDLIQVSDGKALITDWKTGRYKPDGEYDDQLNLYAVAALVKNPKLKAAEGQLIFTDHGPEPVRRATGLLTRAQLPAAKAKWEKRVRAMLTDTTFPARPGSACRFCPFSKSRGGPCRY